MPDLLDRILKEVRERLDASRAAVQEYDRLERALEALTGNHPAGAPSGEARARRRPDGSRRGGRTGSGVQRRRAARGANRDAVLRVINERPGITVNELSTASGVARNTLYPLLRVLTERGEIRRRELPGGQTGYASSGPAVAAAR